MHLFTHFFKTTTLVDRIGLSLIGLIPITELLSTRFVLFHQIGVILWISMWAYIIYIAVRTGAHITTSSAKNKSPFTLLTIALFLFLIATNINSIYSVNGESTQEISCTLQQLQSADWGYRKTCLFGYPTRGYIIPALPSLVFGRSLVALNLGGAFYFIIGLIFFCRGIQVYIQDPRKADAFTLLLTGSLLHFHYVNHFLFLFEQSIFPLSFALAGCGIWLMYLRTGDKKLLIPFTLFLYIMTFTYTPSLALLPLAYGAILWQMIKNKSLRFQIAGTGLISLSAFMMLLSFTFRRDIDFGHHYPGGAWTMLADAGKTLQHLAFHIYPTPYTTWVFTPLLFILILLPLFGIFGTTAQAVSIWCIGVFCIAIYSKGYTYYHLEFRLHRFIMVLPIVFALWASIYNTHRHKVHLGFTLALAACVTITGLYNFASIQLSRPINQQYRFIHWMQSQEISTKTKLYQLSSSTPKNNFFSLHDTMQYFYPDISINTEEKLPADCGLDRIHGLFLLLESDRCANTIQERSKQQDKILYIGTYTGVKDEPLVLYQVRQ